MTDTTFVDGSTLTSAAWFNAMNDLYYTTLAGVVDTGVLTKVAFPATQVPSSGANDLDDYEEGSWTPTDGSGASLSLTVVADGCIYYKIGQIVICFIDITYPITANGSSAQVNGLPYASKNTTNLIGSGQPGVQNVGADLAIAVAKNASGINFYVTGTGRTNAQMSGNLVRGCFIYAAAA